MSQAELAKASGVGVVTISRCETGKPIHLITAKKLLKALNAKRQEQGLALLTTDDLDWKIAR
jgi:DNA-binding XRE family transcriptional regulator